MLEEAGAARRGPKVQVRPLLEVPRQSPGGETIAPLDLWRVHLEQCPECGRTHGGGRSDAPGSSSSPSGRPERHLYEFTRGVPEDLLCPLCGEAFQGPVRAPCGHHYCSLCVRTLLTRAAGRAACPLDGQAMTRFAVRPADEAVVERVESLMVRCPVCSEEIPKAALQLHLQDPVRMVESPEAYSAILRPFYLSCPLSNFTVGELNGSAALVRAYQRLGEETLGRFVLTTDDFIVLPDPKMGFQPQTDEDVTALRKQGGYFNAWWVHPRFRSEVWWRKDALEALPAEATGNNSGANSPANDEQGTLLAGRDCSTEPWHESSFVHTWSTVRKPSAPRYLCCLRDLRGEDLSMLEAFRRNVLDFLRKNYFVDEEKVWIYCHYPSSARYSTLHFHIIFGGDEGSRFTRYAQKRDRPHQLTRQFALVGIIEALKRDPCHFETCTLSYFLGDKADLMDPISAFFGLSPHRYLQGFTFRWDPAIAATAPGSPGAAAAAATAAAEGLGEAAAAASAARLDGADGATAAARPSLGGAAEERVALQLLELRRALEDMQRGLRQLGELAGEVARNQRLEESGAYKLAMAQLAGLPAARAPAPTGLWVLAGAAVGGAVAALAVASTRWNRER